MDSVIQKRSERQGKMKNIEKYPNTKDALDAHNKLNSRELFETWLELEFEETREQSVTNCNRLGNAAKEEK